MTTTGRVPPAPPDKQALRRHALERRDALPAYARIEMSVALGRRVVALDLPPGDVAAYWPIRSEVDPRPAADKLRAQGRALALPCVAGDTLVFRLWAEGDALTKGGLGLMEPSTAAPVIRPAVLLVPLAAFDRRGHRIGYGRGFYDRAIAALGPALTIGLGFSTQEIPLIPDEPHDHPLDFVVTERETIDTRALRGS